MKRYYSLALHDVRVSGGESSMKAVKELMDSFKGPLTIHLIFDKALNYEDLFTKFIIENIKNGRLEIVFHGLTHQCSKKVPKILSFYHKYQAEYLEDSETLREASKKMYSDSRHLLGHNLGICPPCWISIKKNIDFFKSLKPLFIENLLSISSDSKKLFSPVISLGSPETRDLIFLKALAWIMFMVSIVKRNTHLRIAIHLCDLEKPASRKFFSDMLFRLDRFKFKPLLLNELIKY
jgi:hypothetical protein